MIVDKPLSNNRGYTRVCMPCKFGEYGNGIKCVKQQFCSKGEETDPMSLESKKVSIVK